MLQSTDPDRLSTKEGSRSNVWISLGRGNRIDYVGGLEVLKEQKRSVWRGSSGGRDYLNLGDRLGVQCGNLEQ